MIWSDGVPLLGREAGQLPFSTQAFTTLVGCVNVLPAFLLNTTLPKARYNFPLSTTADIWCNWFLLLTFWYPYHIDIVYSGS